MEKPMPQKKKELHKYSIQDLSHARNVLARVSQYGSPSEKSKVRSAVYSRWARLNPEGE